MSDEYDPENDNLFDSDDDEETEGEHKKRKEDNGGGGGNGGRDGQMVNTQNLVIAVDDTRSWGLAHGAAPIQSFSHANTSRDAVEPLHSLFSQFGGEYYHHHQQQRLNISTTTTTTAETETVLMESPSTLLSSSPIISALSNESQFHISHYLPQRIARVYTEVLGIQRLYPWQVEFLSQETLEGNSNFFYSAPTSAGKSLVAEILMLRLLSDAPSTKVFYVVPYRSIVQEKADHFRKILHHTGIGVKAHGASRLFEFVDENITICTTEKASTLLNKMISTAPDRINEDLGMIVIDEIHMIANAERGAVLEFMLSKLKFLALKSRIIGMSATLEGIDGLATWLGAKWNVTSYRPIPLHEHIVTANDMTVRVMQSTPSAHSEGDHSHTVGHEVQRVLDAKSLKVKANSYKCVITLCQEVVDAKMSALVFEFTRRDCRETCMKLAQHINHAVRYISEDEQAHLTKARQQHVENIKSSGFSTDEGFENAMLKGITYHHAGMTQEALEEIIRAFTNGSINIIVCTTTLSAGVNLPVRRTIFNGIQMSKFKNSRKLEVLEYKQASGRAGRAGFDSRGETYIICKEYEKLENAIKLVTGKLPPVRSSMDARIQRDNNAKKQIMSTGMLEMVAADLTRTPAQIEEYVQSTLLHHLCPYAQREQLHTLTNNAIEMLITNKLIIKKTDSERNALYEASSFGRGVYAGGFSMRTALSLYKLMKEFKSKPVLMSEHMLIYIAIPVDQVKRHFTMNIPWWTWSTCDNMPIVDIAKQIDPSFDESFFPLVTRGFVQLGTHSHLKDKLARLYGASMICEVIEEKTIGEVAEKFGILAGDLQNLLKTTGQYCAMLHSFCGEIPEFKLFRHLFAGIYQRLAHGAKDDLVDLLQLEDLTVRTARALHNAGFKTPGGISVTHPKDIANILLDTLPIERVNDDEQRDQMDLLAETIVKQARVISGIKDPFHANQSISNIFSSWSSPSDSRSMLFSPILIPGKSFRSPLSSSRRTPKARATPHIPQMRRRIDFHADNKENERITNGTNVSKTEINACMSGQQNSAIPTSPPRKRRKSAHLTAPDMRAVTAPRQQHNELEDPKGAVSGFICPTQVDLNMFISSRKRRVEIADDQKFSRLLSRWKRTREFSVSFAFRGTSRTAVNKEIVTAVSIFFPRTPLEYCQNVYFVDMMYNDEGDSSIHQLDSADKLKRIKVLLEREENIVHCYKLKDTMSKLMKHDIVIKGRLCDPFIADWVYNPGSGDRKYEKTLKEIASDLFPTLKRNMVFADQYSNVKQSTVHRLTTQCALQWCCMVVLRQMLENQQLLPPFEQVEMKMVPILSLMEHRGMPFDSAYLLQCANNVLERINVIEETLFQEYNGGEKFNTKSPSEVATFLYQTLHLPEPEMGVLKRKRKKGHHPVTDKESLAKINHPAAELIMELRGLRNVDTKQLESLPTRVGPCPDTGTGERVFYRWLQTASCTGRLSTNEPNMQNIPHAVRYIDPKTNEQKSIHCRNAFRAPPAYVIISFDFSQIEARLLAHFSGDTNLQEFFNSDSRDFFRQVATKIFTDKCYEDISDEMRAMVKHIFYGLIYGMGTAALSSALECDIEEAALLSESFLHSFERVKSYLSELPEQVKQDGFVETIYHRRRYMKHINDSDWNKRSQAERNAINTKCQGSAADLAKRAMIRCSEKLGSLRTLDRAHNCEKYSARMILQIHDEFLFEVHETCVLQVCDIVRRCMETELEQYFNLTVRMPIKISVGKSWGDIRPATVQQLEERYSYYKVT